MSTNNTDRPTDRATARNGRLAQLRERQARRADRRSRLRRHLLRALTGIALAAALLGGLQLLALSGIDQARQAALEQASRRDREGYVPSVTPTPSVTPATHAAPTVTPVTPVTPASPVNTLQGNSNATQGAPSQPAQPDWVTQDTGAAYDRTDLAASPLSLPRCTASPTTPMPCLAHVSADSRRAVILEEDASLTALIRR